MTVFSSTQTRTDKMSKILSFQDVCVWSKRWDSELINFYCQNTYVSFDFKCDSSIRYTLEWRDTFGVHFCCQDGDVVVEFKQFEDVADPSNMLCPNKVSRLCYSLHQIHWSVLMCVGQYKEADTSLQSNWGFACFIPGMLSIRGKAFYMYSSTDESNMISKRRM